MQQLIDIIKNALHIVQADASKQTLPLFKTMVQNIMASPTDPANAVLQFNEFLTAVLALLPSLNREFSTLVGNAIIAWAESTAGTTPPPAA